jgi:hypothetical protein
MYTPAVSRVLAISRVLLNLVDSYETLKCKFSPGARLTWRVSCLRLVGMIPGDVDEVIMTEGR